MSRSLGGFGSNISSLQAQRRLSQVSQTLQRSFERLSTGQRINAASDDAAGLAIADRLRVNTRLYSGANRNISDALSMLNIADSTIQDQSGILMRLQELAEQSANGVFTSTQRSTLNREYQSLIREFGRLGDSAKFNGTSLLRSGGATTTIQAGINGQGGSTISIVSGETGSISGVIDLDDNPEPWSGGSSVASMSFATLASTYRNHLLSATVTDSAGQSHDVLISLRQALADYGGTIKVELFARSSEVGPVGYNYDGGGFNTIQASDEWTLAGNQAMTWYALDPSTGKLTLDPGTDAFKILAKFNSGTRSATVNLDLTALVVKPSSTSGKQQSSIDFTGIENVARARDALTVLNRRLVELSSMRGDYGAVQSRLETSMALVQSFRDANAAAESRIRDVDVAAETARLTSSQILQQAAASVLAQTNRQPTLYLDLLRST